MEKRFRNANMPGTGPGPSDIADWDWDSFWDSLLDSWRRVVAVVLFLFFWVMVFVLILAPTTVNPLVIVLPGTVVLLIVLLILRAQWVSARWGVKEPASEEEDIPDSQNSMTQTNAYEQRISRRQRRLPRGEDYHREEERISEEEQDFEGESGPKED